jgi:hypothetical protein
MALLARTPTTWMFVYCVVSRKLVNILFEYFFQYLKPAKSPLTTRKHVVGIPANNAYRAMFEQLFTIIRISRFHVFQILPIFKR